MDKEIMKNHRLSNFKAKIEKARYGDFEGEILLFVTHNGYQWTSLQLAPIEAKVVCEKIQKHFNFKI